jgi:hypothetical protein
MSLSLRLRAAAGASLKHLLLSLLVALLGAVLVFAFWYPYPYDELVGGQSLFLIMISVDVSCGPLLTLVVFNPKKPRAELWRDIGIIVVLQLAALVYGLSSVAQARPVFLAFEKDHFQVVRLPDIDLEHLPRAPAALRHPGWSGPRLIGVRVVSSTDPNFLKSIQLSLAGLPPAFRPESWVDYNQQRQAVVSRAKPVAKLLDKYPSQRKLIEAAIAKSGLSENKLGFLPLTAITHTDWVVLVSLTDAEPKGFLHLDGW